MTEPTPPLAKCQQCAKPSWNKQVIKWQLARFKAYYCIACNPFMNTQNEEAAGRPTAPVEPVYQRPQEEVQKEIQFFDTHSILDVPF